MWSIICAEVKLRSYAIHIRIITRLRVRIVVSRWGSRWGSIAAEGDKVSVFLNGEQNHTRLTRHKIQEEDHLGEHIENRSPGIAQVVDQEEVHNFHTDPKQNQRR